MSLEQWNSARYINFNNLNSLNPKVYNHVNRTPATHILHEENIGGNMEGSDYTAVCTYRADIPGTVGVWAFATQKYGLVSQHGNMQIAIK